MILGASIPVGGCERMANCFNDHKMQTLSITYIYIGDTKINNTAPKKPMEQSQ